MNKWVFFYLLTFKLAGSGSRQNVEITCQLFSPIEHNYKACREPIKQLFDVSESSISGQIGQTTRIQSSTRIMALKKAKNLIT